MFCNKIAVAPKQTTHRCDGYGNAIRDSTTMKLPQKRPVGCTQQLVLQWAFAFGTLTSALLIALSVFLTPWIKFVEAQIEIEVGITKTCIRIFNQSNCTTQWQALNGGDLVGTILLISSIVTLLFCLAWFAAIMARSRRTKKLRCSLVIVTVSSMLAFMLSLSGLVCIAGHRENNTPGLNTLRVIIDPDMISHHSGPSVIMAMTGVWWTFLNTAISCTILYGHGRAPNRT
ncbi:hypothetical protein TTRE_0000449901 [Trichuris trichiura]|uniref:Uncharacterized protein n=1 Tax=Trichuris trichiura TaxID=36087 RepID=A0A077Z8Y5_TRITR|nr:hypothetical protein TTRE_0000449901 [Trichuris trichiura]